jgi:formamidopyrimidine-DNA glycosylase
MPELAEVEIARRRVEKALKRKKIVRVVPAFGDRTVFDKASPEEVKKALLGAKVKGTGRVGKYFWIELDRRPWVVLHLGMTGNVVIEDKRGNRTEGWGTIAPDRGARVHGKIAKKPSSRKTEELPRFSRLFLVASDGTKVAMTDPRRFGRIRLAENPREESPIAGLGYDPLVNPPTARHLEDALARRRIAVKTVLLDQGIFAGIGNWLADEILYQARLDPHRAASSLTKGEIARLRSKMLEVVHRAVRVDADSEKFPKGWLFHRRWSKGRDAKDAKEKLLFDTIGGRTSAWSPSRQK